MAEKWVQKAFSKNKGGLHRDLGVPQGEPIPPGKLERATHSSDPKVRKRAQLAKTSKKFKKGKKTSRRGGRR